MLGREATYFQKALIALHGMESGHLDRQAIEIRFGMRTRQAAYGGILPGLSAGTLQRCSGWL